jgi:uncharacterized protein (DUF362 family)/Pyruvate/2-oxoacid:ferredoxin oxidoreductase delta subunit
MSNVALLKCTAYNREIIRKKILDGFDLIGFDPKQFQNKKVVLKPNLLTGAAPEKAVITHPVFFHAALEIVKENGGIPILAENPATRPLSKVADAVGYTTITDAEGIQVADVRRTSAILVDKPLKFKRFEISSIFCEADFIVNLPKLKTHSLTILTGAVKNFLGTIPGMGKSQWHLRAPSSKEFSELLLDLNECLYTGLKQPVKFLHIMDGIVGMEGEGPGPSGKPRPVGAILVSEDPIALDLAAARLIDLDISAIHTITGGFQRPFGISSAAELSVVGERIADLKPSDYKSPRKKNLWDWLLRSPFIAKRFKNALIEKPVPRKEACTLCYQCKTICPAGAIDVQDTNKQVPAYDYDKCIRCFCCMEICPEAAIVLKRGGLQWLFRL